MELSGDVCDSEVGGLQDEALVDGSCLVGTQVIVNSDAYRYGVKTSVETPKFWLDGFEITIGSIKRTGTMYGCNARLY